MAEIFLIHHASDDAVAAKLVEEIVQAGVTIATLADLRQPTELAGQLAEAKVVIVIWSPRSVVDDWYRRPAGVALRFGKLVALRTHDLPPAALPPGFIEVQTALVDDWPAIETALSAAFERAEASPAEPLPESDVAQIAKELLASGDVTSDATPPAPSMAPMPAAIPAPTPPPAAAAPMPFPLPAPAPAPPPPPVPPAPAPSRPRTEGIGAAASSLPVRRRAAMPDHDELRPGAELSVTAQPQSSRPNPGWTLEHDRRDRDVVLIHPPIADLVAGRGPRTADPHQLAALREHTAGPRFAAAPLADPPWYKRILAGDGALASKSGGASLPFPIVVGLQLVTVLVGLAVITFIGRDRIGEFASALGQHAERLLAFLGLVKGAMPPLPGLASPEVASQQPAAIDDVDCSVFAPPAAGRGSRIMVQVFLHTIEQADRAAFLAQAMDETATLRGMKTLQVPIARRTPVEITLDGRGLAVAEPTQRLIWNGNPSVASFEARVPVDFEPDSCHPVALVTIAGEPVGRILFQIKIDAATRTADTATSAPHLSSGASATRYQYAFLSYASKDRAEVLKRAQALQAAKMRFFQDVLSLTPGQRYTEVILDKISGSDLFIVFWSRHARQSEWVRKEIDHALACQREDPDGLPDIVPIMLESVQKAPPLPSLAHLHMNAPINALIAQSEPSLVRRIWTRLFG